MDTIILFHICTQLQHTLVYTRIAFHSTYSDCYLFLLWRFVRTTCSLNVALLLFWYNVVESFTLHDATSATYFLEREVTKCRKDETKYPQAI